MASRRRWSLDCTQLPAFPHETAKFPNLPQLVVIFNGWQVPSHDAHYNRDIVILVEREVSGDSLGQLGNIFSYRCELPQACGRTSQQIQPNAQMSLAKPGKSPANSSGAAHRTVQAGPVIVMDSPDETTSAFSHSIATEDFGLDFVASAVSTPSTWRVDLEPAGRAEPKSVITARCSEFTRILSCVWVNLEEAQKVSLSHSLISCHRDRWVGSCREGNSALLQRRRSRAWK